jgi:hypothetical protein
LDSNNTFQVKKRTAFQTKHSTQQKLLPIKVISLAKIGLVETHLSNQEDCNQHYQMVILQ